MKINYNYCIIHNFLMINFRETCRLKYLFYLQRVDHTASIFRSDQKRQMVSTYRDPLLVTDNVLKSLL